MIESVRVRLWGRYIGAARWDATRSLGVFQYEPEFAGSGIEVAPLVMRLSPEPYEFPSLARATFHGLPGLLADSLPDRFGTAVLDAWLAGQRRAPGSLNPIERLCYTGVRGMGALEFEPAMSVAPDQADVPLDVASLVALANRVLNDRQSFTTALAVGADGHALESILRVGTSAGGARAKAVIAWNAQTGDVRSGQVPLRPGFEPWLIKFDGIANNADKELADPQGFGRIEFAYSRMARAAGITMAPCHLLEEGGRAHFMTRRFDRTESGDKLHMQSLGALCHYDFNQAGAYAYEQAIDAMRRLDLGLPAIEQMVRRALFNVVARNQDDHVKNIAFLMHRDGRWELAPAFDVTYAFNPDGAWTGRHQMRLRGKRDDFEHEDLVAFALASGIRRTRARNLIAEIDAAVGRWSEFAEDAKIAEADAVRIARAHRRVRG